MNTAVFFCLVFGFLKAPCLVFGAATGLSDEEATNACKTELNLDDSTLQGFDLLKDYDESNTKYNDLLSCSWKKLGFQGADGKIDFPEFIQYLTELCQVRAAAVFSVVPDQATVEGWLANCKDLQGNTHGQTAAKVHFCLTKGIDKFRETHSKH